MQWIQLRLALMALGAITLMSQPFAQEKISDGVVKIGVLTDLSVCFLVRLGKVL
jgi:hypothetical protein